MTTLRIGAGEYEIEPFGVPPRDVPSWKLTKGDDEPLICSVRPPSCTCAGYILTERGGAPSSCKHLAALRRHLKETGK